ncbi:MAG: hypothetical protein AAF492_11645, partial [Verrucomicrobiota bacterium]
MKVRRSDEAERIGGGIGQYSSVNMNLIEFDLTIVDGPDHTGLIGYGCGDDSESSGAAGLKHVLIDH